MEYSVKEFFYDTSFKDYPWFEIVIWCNEFGETIGIRYDTDYNSSYTSRSLIDKVYLNTIHE